MTLEEKCRAVQDVISVEILKRIKQTLVVGERIVLDYYREPSADFPFLCMQMKSIKLGYGETIGIDDGVLIVPIDYYSYKGDVGIDAGKPITVDGKYSILRYALLGTDYPGYRMVYYNGSSNDALVIPITELRTGEWTGDTDGGVTKHSARPYRSGILNDGIYSYEVVHLREPFMGIGYVYEYMGGI